MTSAPDREWCGPDSAWNPDAASEVYAGELAHVAAREAAEREAGWCGFACAADMCAAYEEYARDLEARAVAEAEEEAEAEAAYEAEWADEWDSAEADAYMDRMEAEDPEAAEDLPALKMMLLPEYRPVPPVPLTEADLEWLAEGEPEAEP